MSEPWPDDPHVLLKHRNHPDFDQWWCKFCQIERQMQRKLTPEAFQEWMDRDDHEEMLTAYNPPEEDIYKGIY